MCAYKPLWQGWHSWNLFGRSNWIDVKNQSDCCKLEARRLKVLKHLTVTLRLAQKSEDFLYVSTRMRTQVHKISVFVTIGCEIFPKIIMILSVFSCTPRVFHMWSYFFLTIALQRNSRFLGRFSPTVHRLDVGFQPDPAVPKETKW